MRFLFAIVHRADVDPIDASSPYCYDEAGAADGGGEEDDLTAAVACSCLRQRPSAAVEPAFALRVEECLRDVGRHNVQDRWRATLEAFQEKMRSLRAHPLFGVPDPRCPHCQGRGTAESTVEKYHFDYAGPDAAPWSKHLFAPIRQKGIWQVPWDLELRFREAVPGVELADISVLERRSGLFGAILGRPPRRQGWTREGSPADGPVPVAAVCELGLIPGCVALIDRDGRWHEDDVMEDRATWHGQVEAVLRASTDLQLTVMSAHS